MKQTFANIRQMIEAAEASGRTPSAIDLTVQDKIDLASALPLRPDGSDKAVDLINDLPVNHDKPFTQIVCG